MILYESPNRVGVTFTELAKSMGGDRQCALVREMTKLHEEAVRGTLSELSEIYAETPPRGECVIVVSGASEQENAPASPEEIARAIDEMRAAGSKPRAIAKEIAQRFSMTANEAYELVVGRNE